MSRTLFVISPTLTEWVKDPINFTLVVDEFKKTSPHEVLMLYPGKPRIDKVEHCDRWRILNDLKNFSFSAVRILGEGNSFTKEIEDRSLDLGMVKLQVDASKVFSRILQLGFEGVDILA